MIHKIISDSGIIKWFRT